MDIINRKNMAYLAGAFDGDGSFSLIKKIENIEGAPLYYPMIQFGSKDRIIVDALLEEFGGYVSVRKPYVGKDGASRQQFYTYKLEKRKGCLPFLEKIIPFLRIKKERAQAILDFINQNPFVRGSKKLDKEILLDRERSYQGIRKMNLEYALKPSLRPKKLQPYDPVDFWHYVAGLMDTDGSFSINLYRYSPMVSLSMNDLKGIEYIQSSIGSGSLLTIKAKTCKTGFTYRWQLRSIEQLHHFLKNISPCLRVKGPAANLLLDFLEKREPCFFRRGGVPADTLKMRHDYYERLCYFNKYGVLKPSLIDLEAQEQGNKAEGESHRERLNEMA